MYYTLVFMWQQFETFQNKESTLWTPTQIYLVEQQAKHIKAMKMGNKAQQQRGREGLQRAIQPKEHCSPMQNATGPLIMMLPSELWRE